MRLFAAIVPPPDVLDALDVELERLEVRSADSPLRWSGRSLWHMTLAFYGEADLEERTRFVAEQVRGHPSLRLGFAGAGTFSGVLWAGVEGDVEELGALADALRGPVDADTKPFHPHLTLARWKRRSAQRPARRIAAALADYRSQRWQADEVVLMSSVRDRHGPTYTVEYRAPLAG
ncbi:RNA 2',3'-cyclic phosphodiesterase [Haloechinothrix halophila]|uniref:RNA 2',3'-cyclic phosphodiesterase n=1 Tax=Haloechinothrix halophila TaxID=1069073 RepID=UPI00041DB391|nr:RNA 2',3'-cyclic phosphodiesterase [Haloechinothrix halophila]